MVSKGPRPLAGFGAEPRDVRKAACRERKLQAGARPGRPQGGSARVPDENKKLGVGGEVNSGEMDRFVSTFINKVDAKGRVSIPAPFRAVLERDGYAGGIYCYPSLDAPALDAGGERLAKKIDGLLASLPDYSDERDELSVALYGDVQVLSIDGDGRIVLPEGLRAHASLSGRVAFVGLGDKFQMWEPDAFEERRRKAREKVRDHRKLLGSAGELKAGGE